MLSSPQHNRPGAERWERTIRRYRAYTALKGVSFGLFAALWVIYLQRERGLSLAQAALIDVTFFVAATVGEVPTGMVADRWGRKRSLTIGTVLLGVSALAWTFAPTVPLIMLAYIGMGVGFTFLSGAEDALFYETVRRAGRAGDYTRLAGRVAATMTGGLALGSVASGLLASVSLRLPFLVATGGYVLIVALVLSFHEPPTEAPAEPRRHVGFVAPLRQAFTLISTRPAVRFAMLYLAVVPLAALILETLFVQPQAVAVGVPLAGVGVVVMALQLATIVGASCADRVARRLGEGPILVATPLVIIGCLLLLAAWQVAPALSAMALLSLVTALQRPIAFNRIQAEVADRMRATLLSVQSLLFTLLAALAQPTLGFIADRQGLPASYLVLAGSLGLACPLLILAGRGRIRPMSATPSEGD